MMFTARKCAIRPDGLNLLIPHVTGWSHDFAIRKTQPNSTSRMPQYYWLTWSCLIVLWCSARENSMKRVAIYIRVSTSKQDTDNQRRELQAVAQRSGWEIVHVYEDAGISGA